MKIKRIFKKTRAVSRFHQPRGFMPLNDGINHFDHDFPEAKGYKLEVSGSMLLNKFSQEKTRRSRSLNRGHRETGNRDSCDYQKYGSSYHNVYCIILLSIKMVIIINMVLLR